MSLLREIRDPLSTVGVIARRARQKRFKLFTELLCRVPRPIRILDIGGTRQFWEAVNYVDLEGIDLVLVNVEEPTDVSGPNMHFLQADARDLRMFADSEFDVVLSNSVIEHVGGLTEQHRMANEVRRVGRRYFIQTPNRFFPIEPHFMFPMFQFLPRGVQVSLLMNFDLAWTGKIADRERAEAAAKSVRLLSRKEFTAMFPEAAVYEERFLGLTKSFVCYAGW